jgi:hypothetical protein
VIIMTIASTATNSVGAALAIAGGVCVAASDVALDMATQMSPVAPLPGQMTVIGLAISLIGFGTAGLPHAYNSLRLMYEDRKDRRAAERALFEHNNRIIELANNLNRTTSRLDALEGIEEAARELKRRYEDLEARYEREVNGELKPGIKTNSAGLSAILDSWHDRNPPPHPDPSDPLPHPEFDPLPDEPNPLARRDDDPDAYAMPAPSIETSSPSLTRH